MDTATEELMIDWDYAWRGVAFAVNNFKLLESKGRYGLNKVEIEPKLRLSTHIAVGMGIEPGLAKRMLEK